MKSYYSEKLSAGRLQRCYEIAPPRVQQYLAAEIAFVSDRISGNDIVLDLGCGYGRITPRLLEKAKMVVGIDLSEENIRAAHERFKSSPSVVFQVMNAADLQFPENHFDVTICIQNGISAFGIEPGRLLSEALRVTKKTGIVLFSSYSENFWQDRLNWFELQAAEGLIGEIDYQNSGDGIIVCKDGFRAATFSENDFIELAKNFAVETRIYEIDKSSVFCEMKKR